MRCARGWAGGNLNGYGRGWKIGVRKGFVTPSPGTQTAPSNGVPAAAAQLTQPPALNQLTRRRNSEQPPAQYANEAEDARTEQHDAAGLRNRGTAIPTAPAGQSESFRRNRANGVRIGRRRAAVLIPVDRVANREIGRASCRERV